MSDESRIMKFINLDKFYFLGKIKLVDENILKYLWMWTKTLVVTKDLIRKFLILRRKNIHRNPVMALYYVEATYTYNHIYGVQSPKYQNNVRSVLT